MASTARWETLDNEEAVQDDGETNSSELPVTPSRCNMTSRVAGLAILLGMVMLCGLLVFHSAGKATLVNSIGESVDLNAGGVNCRGDQCTQNAIVNKFYRHTMVEALQVHLLHSQHQWEYDYATYSPDFEPSTWTNTSCSVHGFRHKDVIHRKASNEKESDAAIELKMQWYQYPGNLRQSREESWLMVLLTNNFQVDWNSQTYLNLEYSLVKNGTFRGWMVFHGFEHNGFVFLNGVKVSDKVSSLNFPYHLSRRWKGNVNIPCTLAEAHFVSLCYPADYNTSQWEFPEGKRNCSVNDPAELSERLAGKQHLEPTDDDGIGWARFDVTHLVRAGYRVFRVFMSNDGSANPQHVYNHSTGRRLIGGSQDLNTPSISIRSWHFENVLSAGD